MSLQRQYFGTDGIRGRTGVTPITAEFALKLGWAVGKILAEEGQGSVLMGKDTRVSGSMLSAALEAGLISSGVNVLLAGTLPTPGVAYLTRALNASAGVMVSASHNPYYDNGIKFFGASGKKLPDDVETRIEALLTLPMTTAGAKDIGRSHVLEDAASKYIAFCKHTFPKTASLEKLTVVLDCANGATSDIAPHLFTELGAEVIALHHEPDGFNINEQCGSTHPESLRKAVLSHQADIGIAFDGDGDRVLLIDHQGELVDGDEILFILAEAFQEQGQLNGGVVGTLMSNLGLEKALNERNIPFKRTKVGDRYVMEGLVETGWLLGGEASGHIIAMDKTTTGDGIVSALQVLAQLCRTGRSLSELKKGMTKCGQILVNVPAQNGAKVMEDPRVKHTYQQAEKDLMGKGRILLRSSGTEPLVRVMVEGEDQQFISQIANEMAQMVQTVAKAM